ncbi:hypothetical protein C8J56DRAFT_1087843 [Mycena floridula]|nr:hypothetical protein C8J56DRAFT_1087843 [Mycena floridula]
MNPHTELLQSIDKIGSYAQELDLNSSQILFLSRLTSLQTIMRLMGVQISSEFILDGVNGKLCNIAGNLDLKRPGQWPFNSEDEQEITVTILYVESLLSSRSLEALSHSVAVRDPDPGLNARLTTYKSGSSVHFHADHTVTDNIEGSFMSNNTIYFDADPAVRQGVDNLIERAIDAETIKKCQAFLDWISKLDFQATQRQTFGKHAMQTGEWFLKKQEFVDWKDGKTKFLWCPGIPGAGKTILSSIIINHLQLIADPTMAVLYTYCDYTRHADQNPTQLLGALLKQLVQHRHSISDHLLTLHTTCLSQGADPTITELITALHTEASLYSHVHIIVDALDECSEDNQARELFFSTHPQGLWSLPDNVHILITSRDILTISQKFQSIPRIPIEAKNEDLQTYIKGRITTDIKLKRLVKGDVMLEAEIIDQVILKAAGMFLQACLHLDALASQLNRRSLRTALRSLPKGIMDSYDAAMTRIHAQGEAEYDLACQIFYWLAYAERPLTIKQLQHAVAVSDDMSEMDFDAIVDVDVLTSVCAGLIVIREERVYLFGDLSDDKIIQLVHYTAQEYFQFKQQLWFPDIHSSIAIACLTYMAFDTFDTTHITYTTWLLHPLAQYAIDHWEKHAKKDEVTTMPKILKFLGKENNVAHIFSQSKYCVRRWPTTGQAHILAWLGLNQTLKHLISENHTAAMSVDKKGSIPLRYACEFGHIAVVKLLIQQEDIDPAAADKDQRTLLSYAAQQGHMDIAKLLLENNVDPAAADKYQGTPLSYAAEYGHIDIVKLLLEQNVDPAAADKDQRTTLSYAAGWGHIDIVKLLLEQNVNPAAADKDWRTPLSYAAEHGHIDIVKLLLKQNTDPLAADKDQHTPLMYAAEQGHIDIVKLLLEQDAVNLNIPDKDEKTPPDACC